MMNSTIYIFGNMQQGYTQYPDDETTHEIFQTFALNAKAPTQIAIHRDGSLMYYGYIRKLQGDQYIGLCILINSRVFANVLALFSLFEQTIEKLAEFGYLIKFDMQGNLIANTQHLYMSKNEIDTVSGWLQQQIGGMEADTSALPPVNYAIASNSVQVFSYTEEIEKIVESTTSNGYTFVLKAEDYNTVNLDSYQAVVASQAQQIATLKQKVEMLQKGTQPIQPVISASDDNSNSAQQPFSYQPNSSVDIGEAYSLFWKNYFKFSGRSRRSEFWWASLINNTILVIGYLFYYISLSSQSNNYYSSNTSSGGGDFILILMIVFSLATFIPSIALVVRRLHDTGRSGWWLLLGLIPFVNYIGGIILFIFECQDSQPGINQWGVSPKYAINIT